MASERQIAANRRNAEKSTGPRSAEGKKRSSKNALKHGLTKPLSGVEFLHEVDQHSKHIAGEKPKKSGLEHARHAAAADLEIRRLRQFKVDLIEALMKLEAVESPGRLYSPRDQVARAMRQLAYGRNTNGGGSVSADAAGQDEAIRRALPELAGLVRYEKRAAGRRDRAIQKLLGVSNANESGACSTGES